MARHEQSIFIARRVADVFAYMDDIEREREWQPHLVEAEQTPPGPTAVGTRKRYVSEFMRKRIGNTYVVTVCEPGRRIVAETTDDSALDARSDVRWEAVDGGTRVTMELEGSAAGAFRLVPARVLEKTFEKEVDQALARLKERLERDG